MPRMSMSNSTVDEYNARVSRRRYNIEQTPATEKQIAFIEKLQTELTDKIAKAVSTTDVVNINLQFMRARRNFLSAKSNNAVTKVVASLYISELLQMNNYPFVIHQLSTQITSAPRQEPAAIGVYKKDGDYYRVATLRNSDRRAAYRWNGRRWDYARGYVFQLTANELLSVEEVRAFGLRTGMCAICGRTLTDPESVQKGIGPICEGKYGRFLASVSA